MRALVRSLAALLAASALAACARDKPLAADAGPASNAPDAALALVPAGLSDDDARAVVKGACMSCHTDEMLAQQRLTTAQWTKVVTKMVGWGANLETKDTAPLIAWLSASYGPDAGAYTTKPISAAEATAALAETPDGPFANGDAERGRALYTDRCSGCHGPEAKGGVGVLLVDRPFLRRAAELAETIRRGRGKMTPIALGDAEIADVLAHLRRLKNP